MYIKYTFKLFGFWLLVDLSLGAALWRKASVEISDALIHITMPLLNADGLDYIDFAPTPKISDLLRWEWLREKLTSC